MTTDAHLIKLILEQGSGPLALMFKAAKADYLAQIKTLNHRNKSRPVMGPHIPNISAPYSERTIKDTLKNAGRPHGKFDVLRACDKKGWTEWPSGTIM